MSREARVLPGSNSYSYLRGVAAKGQQIVRCGGLGEASRTRDKTCGMLNGRRYLFRRVR